MKRMALLGTLFVFSVSILGCNVKKENKKITPFFVSTVSELSQAIRQRNILDGLAISDRFYSLRSPAEKNTVQWLSNYFLQRKKLVLVYGNNVSHKGLKDVIGLNVGSDLQLGCDCGWVDPVKKIKGTAGWPESEGKLTEKRMRQLVVWILNVRLK